MNTQDSQSAGYVFDDLYIAGQWRAGASGRSTEVPSPWSGETVRR